MTEGETNALRTALKAAIDQGDYSKLANFHGAPFTMCNPLQPDGTFNPDRGAGCCPHSHHMFLIWHRLLMANLDHVSFQKGQHPRKQRLP